MLDLGKLKLYCGPPNLVGPDNLRTTITNFILDATNTLDIAIQELDDQPIAEAIIAAQQRGVKVRMILEQDYVLPSDGANESLINALQPNASDTHEVNRTLLNAVLRSGASVHVDFNPKIFHQKFIIKDGTKILTGSTNFTTTGVEDNFNHIITVHNTYVADKYQMQFDEMMKGRFGKHSEYDLEGPGIYDVEDVPVSVIFSPDHAPEMVIMKQMLKATQSIKFAVFTFAESSGIDDTMKVLAGSGVQITGVMDRMQSNQTWAASKNLVGANNIQLFRAGGTNGAGKLHYKLMVLDDRVVIAGSFNYTGPANYINDENVIQIGSFTQPDNFNNAEWAVAVQKQQNICTFFSNEVDRIINSQYSSQLL